MNDFLVALQFLTRLPVPAKAVPPDGAAQGRAVLFYPLVGLVVGGLLGIAWWPLSAAPPALAAALLLALWVGLSGGLHLDGLADLGDAWVGGQGDRDRTLAIMKDPCSGPMGVTLLLLVLLVKFAALQVLLEGGHWAPLLLVPLLGRAGLVAALRFLPYVRPGGIGAGPSTHLPRPQAGRVLLACGLVPLLAWGWTGLLLTLLLAAVFLLLRRALMRRLGGVTGDAAGAICELLETLALTLLALAL
ncbi:MAG TPA: adenosylcobinamide-GDP ribazoletransferase [Sedimenticola thiotaurini]|uniref:Adenosylcobinamide-GDP ribazoletransferase n=1 Tax=Sedimenticola thiotaurini TaxID=1543721 RepID=A0A831W975_9GAMM|nr:adenosylcobinamide-GDP ribazoletransferase [Sedimenticola thiotaurini]